MERELSEILKANIVLVTDAKLRRYTTCSTEAVASVKQTLHFVQFIKTKKQPVNYIHGCFYVF